MRLPVLPSYSVITLTTFLFCLFTILTSAQSTFIVRDNNLNGTTTWRSGNTYILDGLVYLESGSLFIESGTIIKGRENPTTGDETSALIITRGANIYADGTEEKPIIFTAESDGNPFPLDFSSGLWGGVIILGYGKLGAENTTETLFGFPSSDSRNTYGGTNDFDNSGRMSYVSIRHAGKWGSGFSFDGLNLAGVGRNTNIHHIEAFACDYGGVGMRGGMVDLKYISISYCRLFGIEWSKGWRGRGQYWLIIHANGVGFPAIIGSGAEPVSNPRFSNPTIYNATIIGEATSPSDPIFLSGGTGGTIANSIFTDFTDKALFIEDDPNTTTNDVKGRIQNGQLKLLNNIWGSFGAGDDFDTDNGGILTVNEDAPDQTASYLTNHLNSNGNRSVGNAKILMGSDYSVNFPDPRYYPDAGFFTTAASTSDSFFDFDTNYPAGCTNHGAFPNANYWIKNWTVLYEYVYDDPYVEYEGNLYQINGGGFGTIELHCSDLPTFEDDYTIYHPTCLAPSFVPVDPLGGGKRDSRAARGRDSGFGANPYQPCFDEFYQQDYNLTYNVINYTPQGVEYEIRNGNVTLNIEDICDPTIEILPPTGNSQSLPYSQVSVVAKDNNPFLDAPTVETNVTQFSNYTRYGFRAVTECGRTSNWVYMDYYHNEPLRFYYADRDNDDYGDANSRIRWRRQPNGFVANNQDCDDTNAQINPAQSEIRGNPFDDNCDGIALSSECSTENNEIDNQPELFGRSEIIHARGKLESDALIYQNSNIIYRSDESIELNAGFTVARGALFKAEIAECSSNYSAEEESENLNISTASITEGEVMEVLVFPNPAKEKAELQFNLPIAESVNIELFDAKQSRIQRLVNNQFLTAGTHQIEIDVHHLVGGIYYVAIQTSTEKQVAKIIIVH